MSEVSLNPVLAQHVSGSPLRPLQAGAARGVQRQSEKPVTLAEVMNPHTHMLHPLGQLYFRLAWHLPDHYQSAEYALPGVRIRDVAVAGDDFHIFVIVGDTPMVITEPERSLFPSDALITKLRLLSQG